MAWTTPKTWNTGDPLTASDLNTHVRDNFNALKAPPTDHYEPDEASDYTTTSTSFVDIDATNLALTMTTTGGDVLVGFHGVLSINGGTPAGYLDVDVDGTRIGGDDGIVKFDNPDNSVANKDVAISFVRLVTGLSAGSHAFKLQWKISASTLTLFAGAGTSGADMHPQFWVREVS